MALLYKSILSDMSIATPAFFSCPFAWKICFQPLIFRLCTSSVLRWVSCRQHMCGSCFLIHSAILCLLIAGFNPITFKVIIDRYLFIAIISYLCSSVFLFSFLSLKQSLSHLLQISFVGGVFFYTSFVWESLYLVFYPD